MCYISLLLLIWRLKNIFKKHRSFNIHFWKWAILEAVKNTIKTSRFTLQLKNTTSWMTQQRPQRGNGNHCLMLWLSISGEHVTFWQLSGCTQYPLSLPINLYIRDVFKQFNKRRTRHSESSGHYDVKYKTNTSETRSSFFFFFNLIATTSTKLKTDIFNEIFEFGSLENHQSGTWKSKNSCLVLCSYLTCG